MDFFKNIKPIQLYMGSIIFFVLSSLARKEYHTLYLLFLILGVVLFFLGIIKRIKK
ncbi:hypothetical protein [Flavobacterium sp.]|uniref:hypothetical protein n=1 Tax=Flavobacterium sp. TaxID=239 RepID=UPI002B4B593C|nr:hypothetical protein [Flavobacterium sp.]HLF51994.1 hypothetical protein [Flavobacterium sp.]